MSAPATVAINLLWLVPGDVGGSEESTVATVEGLARLQAPDLDLRLLVLEPFVAAHPEVVARVPFEAMPLSGRSRAARIVGESTWLSRRTATADLVHHAGGTAPLRAGRPYVLTLHDLQPLERQATHGAAKRAYLGAVVPRSLRGARRVIVPSAFVRDGVLARTDLDPDRVVVVPHGVEAHPAPTPAKVLDATYGLTGPVVLYPAITYPHKNHALLVAAFEQVAAQHPDALLVLSGRADRAEAALDAQIAAAGLGRRVRRLGRVPAADLAGLYRRADVVAVPSAYEGFGLPAAEAMAHGAAVVAADATSLPEIVGDAGRLAPVTHPDDGDRAAATAAVEAWAVAIGGLLADPVERARLADAGRARAAGFSVAANARGVADVYRAALARP